MSTSGMKPEVYNANSALQLRAIQQATPLLKAAAAGAAAAVRKQHDALQASSPSTQGQHHPEQHTLVNVVDFGASQGANSLAAGCTVVQELRAQLFDEGPKGVYCRQQCIGWQPPVRMSKHAWYRLASVSSVSGHGNASLLTYIPDARPALLPPPGSPPPLPGDLSVVLHHNDLPSNDFKSLMTAVGHSWLLNWCSTGCDHCTQYMRSLSALACMHAGYLVDRHTVTSWTAATCLRCSARH